MNKAPPRLPKQAAGVGGWVEGVCVLAAQYQKQPATALSAPSEERLFAELGI